MKFSMRGQEKGDLLIKVTTWAGLTVFCACLQELSVESQCRYIVKLVYKVHPRNLKMCLS
jgi:hypothetical protein